MAVETILKRFNSQDVKPREFGQFPTIDGDQIISAIDIEGITLSKHECLDFIDTFLPGFSLDDFPEFKGEDTIFVPVDLLEIWGILLYPYTAFGILNGGSATTYIYRNKKRPY